MKLSQRIPLSGLLAAGFGAATMVVLTLYGLSRLGGGDWHGLVYFTLGLLAGLVAIGILEAKSGRVSEVLEDGA